MTTPEARLCGPGTYEAEGASPNRGRAYTATRRTPHGERMDGTGRMHCPRLSCLVPSRRPGGTAHTIRRTLIFHERRSRKEVFQPHLPVRLPCYDLAPITSFTLGRSSRLRTSGAPGFHGLTGGVYKARERIHRAMADARLLANPASWSRVADSSPN